MYQPEALVILSINLLQTKYVSRGSTNVFCRTTKAEEVNIRLKDMKSCMCGSFDYLYSSLPKTIIIVNVMYCTQRKNLLAGKVYFREYLYSLNNIALRKINISSYMAKGLGGALLLRTEIL